MTPTKCVAILKCDVFLSCNVMKNVVQMSPAGEHVNDVTDVMAVGDTVSVRIREVSFRYSGYYLPCTLGPGNVLKNNFLLSLKIFLLKFHIRSPI